MGLGNAKIRLKNPARADMAPIEVDALADSGAVYLCIPEHVRIQLKLGELHKKETILADGTRKDRSLCRSN